jgi:hypothetical protein
MDKASEEFGAVQQPWQREYRTLFDEIAALLFNHDPMGINFASNTDEYDPEARTILPRLNTCESVDDVRLVVHEEFCHWFGDGIVGSAESYQKIAKDIWDLWQHSTMR